MNKSNGFGDAAGLEKANHSLSQNFNMDLDKMNTNGLKLPEEDKHNDMADGLFKINFTNDPVMKSLLETKQDQCALIIQRIYLSKQ